MCPRSGGEGFATSSASAPISVVVPDPPLISLIIEDDEVSPHDADLRPRKRNTMDVGEGVPSVADLLEDDFMMGDYNDTYWGVCWGDV